MTIEQYITPFLKEQLQKKLSDYNVLVVTDLTHFNLVDEKRGVLKKVLKRKKWKKVVNVSINYFFCIIVVLFVNFR